MNPSPDISLNVPSELFDEFAEVMKSGLQRANITVKAKKSLSSWWEAERELIYDYVLDKSKTSRR